MSASVAACCHIVATIGYPFIVYTRSLSRHFGLLYLASVSVPFHCSRCVGDWFARVVTAVVGRSIPLTVAVHFTSTLVASFIILISSTVACSVAVTLQLVARCAVLSAVHLCLSHTAATAELRCAAAVTATTGSVAASVQLALTHSLSSSLSFLSLAG